MHLSTFTGVYVPPVLIMDGISQEGKRFRAMVADSRPHYEGRAMLAKLLANGIPCTYLQLNALSYAMQVGALRH